MARKLRARRGRPADAWYGLGLFGLVGWGVAAPTLAGIALGVWLDRTHPIHASWTLIGLGLGLVVGCLNALGWIAREHGAMDVGGRDPARRPDGKEPPHD